jgi:hypothetical protein
MKNCSMVSLGRCMYCRSCPRCSACTSMILPCMLSGNDCEHLVCMQVDVCCIWNHRLIACMSINYASGRRTTAGTLCNRHHCVNVSVQSCATEWPYLRLYGRTARPTKSYGRWSCARGGLSSCMARSTRSLRIRVSRAICADCVWTFMHESNTVS